MLTGALRQCLHEKPFRCSFVLSWWSQFVLSWGSHEFRFPHALSKVHQSVHAAITKQERILVQNFVKVRPSVSDLHLRGGHFLSRVYISLG